MQVFFVWNFFSPGEKLNWSCNTDIKHSVALMNKNYKIGMNAKSIFIPEDNFYYQNLG